MTSPKIARVPVTSYGVPHVERPLPLVKTQELPAFGSTAPDREPDEGGVVAVPCAVADGDITVPVRSSIESTLTFEVLRRQSIRTDDDKGIP